MECTLTGGCGSQINVSNSPVGAPLHNLLSIPELWPLTGDPLAWFSWHQQRHTGQNSRHAGTPVKTCKFLYLRSFESDYTPANLQISSRPGVCTLSGHF